MTFHFALPWWALVLIGYLLAFALFSPTARGEIVKLLASGFMIGGKRRKKR